MSVSIQGTFVSQKINKIRWKPDPFNNCHSFLTGSWDEEQNTIKLWDLRENEECEINPYLLCEHTHNGDVTEAQFLDTDTFACSSSFGSVSFYTITYRRNQVNLEEKTCWKNIHRFRSNEISSCTSITVHDNDIVSVGEDGRINLLTLSSESVVRAFDEADSCSLTCVIFLKHNEIVTGNIRGLLKLWDTRCAEGRAIDSFRLFDDIVTPTCLTNHPTQKHLMLAGDETGSVTIWDLRNNTFPLNQLKTNGEHITELHFHPDDPDQLFTSTLSGDLFHWNLKPKSVLSTNLNNSSKNTWLAADSLKKDLEVCILIDDLHKPINSLDVNQSRLICGCDNEAIYLINDVKLYNY